MISLPPELGARLNAFLDGDVQAVQGEPPGDSPVETPIEILAGDLAAFLDGKSADTLRQLLDTLREVGAYGLSLRILARAWAGTISDELAGEVAQDWIGTLLHGLGDRPAAADIARHLTPDALSRGAAFAGDLGDLLLSWDLRDEAAPLVEFAARRNPGDLSAQYNWGIVLKFQRAWAEAAEVFRSLSVHRQDAAVRWNLGIACTALCDFGAARTAWRAVGLQVPDSDGDFALPGERVPVRLPAALGAPVAAEVVWGDRLCPARVRLTGIPRFSDLAGFSDVVLVDGMPVGETTLNGRNVPIVEALDLFESARGRLFRLRVPAGAAVTPDTPTQLANALRRHGFAATDWRGVGADAPAVGVVLPADAEPASLGRVVDTACAGLPFFCPELDAALGRPTAVLPGPLPRW